MQFRLLGEVAQGFAGAGHFHGLQGAFAFVYDSRHFFVGFEPDQGHAIGSTAFPAGDVPAHMGLDPVDLFSIRVADRTIVINGNDPS